MYEIKKVENEKGKIGKIKDVVKNKLNNLKPKNALKKIAAGGSIKEGKCDLGDPEIILMKGSQGVAE